MNEALRHRVPGFALLTSTQEAKAAEGSESWEDTVFSRQPVQAPKCRGDAS